MFAIGVFCFKQKTADVLRISDWSSDVCSSDLYRRLRAAFEQALAGRGAVDGKVEVAGIDGVARHLIVPAASEAAPHEGIVPAGDIAPPMATAHDHRAIEAAAVTTAVPGIAKTGRADDALEALVDAIIRSAAHPSELHSIMRQSY